MTPLADYIDFTLSPGGGRLALSRIDPQANTADIWILDLARGVETRLTSDRFNDGGVMWPPDGARVYFRDHFVWAESCEGHEGHHRRSGGDERRATSDAGRLSRQWR